MFLNNTWGRTVDLLHRGLDTSVLRRSVIANNLANAETPNFKRSTVNFEAELKRVLDQQKQTPALQALVTDPRHMPFEVPRDYRNVAPRRVLDYLSQVNENGNNVDLDEEMMASMQNQLLYTTMAQSVAGQFNLVNLVLR